MYLPNLSLCDSRYSAPEGAAVDDAPYGIGDRRVWRVPVLVTAPGRQAELFGRPVEVPDTPPILPKLSASALATFMR